MRKRSILALAIFLTISCSIDPLTQLSTPIPPSLTPTKSATSTTLPIITLTSAPTQTETPPSAERRNSSCNMIEILEIVRAQTPYEQFAAHHNLIEGVSTLVVWFVDPELQTASIDVLIEANQQVALKHAVQSAHRIRKVNDCLVEDIDFINTIIVDASYYGWLSAQISPDEIDSGVELDQASISRYIDQLQVGYLRSEPSTLIRHGDCSWREAEIGIWKHFSKDRKNLAFYHVIDEFGVNVWAQWDGPGTYPMMLPSVLNIIMEIECLDPRTNLIFMVVDQDGITQVFGLVPELSIDNLTVFYGG